MKKSRFLRLTSLLTLCLLGLSVVSFAGMADEISFEIPPQSLDSALLAYSEQAEVQLIVDAQILQGIETNGVVGKRTPEEALAELLVNTGLEFSLVGSTVTVTYPNASKDLISGKALPASGMSTPSQIQAPAEDKQSSSYQATSRNSDKASDDLDSQLLMEEVIVTASHIRGGNPTSRIEEIDRIQIDRSGFVTTEDLTRSLTTNYSSRNNGTLFAGGGIAGSEAAFSGASSINLRGLGEGATLVLVNGRRIAGSSFGGQSFVDVSTIPLDAVERVEVLNDGASAIYGSDAVAGIVNFILRRDFTGGELSVGYTDAANDGNSQFGSLTLGTNWDSGQVLGSISIRQEDPITTSKVALTQDFRSIGGRDFRSLGNQPGTFTSLVGFFPTIPAAGEIVTFPGNQDGTNLTSADAIPIFSNEDLPRTDLLSPTLSADIESISGFISLEQSLGNQVRLFVDVLASERDTKTISGPIQIGRAFLLPDINPFSPFVVPVTVEYVANSEFETGSVPSPISTTNVQRLQVNPGLTVDVTETWQAKLLLGYGKEEAKRTARGLLSNDIDPFSTATFIALNDPDPTTALNVFGDGSAQNLSTLAGLVEDIPTFPYKNELTNATLIFDGDLYSLPGGTVKAAIGAEYRDETLSFTDVLVDATGQATFFDAKRSQQSRAIFGELLIPLIGGQNNKSWADSLVLSLAARYEDYKFDVETGIQPGNADLNRFTPKVGIAWGITEELIARASWGESFRVPGLNDLFTPSWSLPIPAFPDPLDPNGIGVAFNVNFNFGGNPDLKEQSGESFVIGLDYQPEVVAGLNLSVSYNRIEFRDLIGDPFSLFGPLEVISRPDLFPDSTTRDAQGFLTDVNFIPANIAERVSDSLDFSIDYVFDSSIGDFRVGINATRTLGLSNVINPEEPPLELAGTIAGPSDWVGRAYLNWSRRGWNGALYINYESSYLNNDIQAAFDKIDSYTTVDLQVSYAWENVDNFLDGTNLSLSLINALDEDFPFVDNQGRRYGVDPTRVDLRGRQVILRLKKVF